MPLRRSGWSPADDFERLRLDVEALLLDVAAAR
jgi:hypothetical protein